MAWIESHQSLRNHPKTKKAMRLLGVSAAELVGLLHFLWWWAEDYAQDGDLSDYDVADIEAAVGWEGEPGRFVQALLDCGFGGKAGFLERGADGQLLIHDWYDYAGKLIQRRKEDLARKNAQHRKNSDGIPTEFQQNSSGIPDEKIRNSHQPTNQPSPSPTNPLSDGIPTPIPDMIPAQDNLPDEDDHEVPESVQEQWQEVFFSGTLIGGAEYEKQKRRLYALWYKRPERELHLRALDVTDDQAKSPNVAARISYYAKCVTSVQNLSPPPASGRDLNKIKLPESPMQRGVWGNADDWEDEQRKRTQRNGDENSAAGGIAAGQPGG